MNLEQADMKSREQAVVGAGLSRMLARWEKIGRKFPDSAFVEDQVSRSKRILRDFEHGSLFDDDIEVLFCFYSLSKEDDVLAMSVRNFLEECGCGDDVQALDEMFDALREAVGMKAKEDE